MLKLYKHLKPYWLQLILMSVFTFLQVMATLQLPDYMAKIVNEGIINQDESLVWSNGAAMVLVTAAGAVCTIISGYLAARVAIGFAKDLRQKVFYKVQEFSLAEFNKFSTASLITRSTNDVQQIQLVTAMAFRMLL